LPQIPSTDKVDYQIPPAIYVLGFAGIAKALSMDLLRQSMGRGTKNAFLTPESYDKKPYEFMIIIAVTVCIHTT